LIAALVAACMAFVLAGCVTTRDAVGGGDARLDEGGGGEGPVAKAKRECGPDGKGDLVLLDARTGGAVTCQPVTLMREAMSCALAADCPSDTVYQGLSNAQGQVSLSGAVERARLVAVAEGFGPSVLSNATSKAGQLLELELAPADGFWVKVLDGDGNYLQDLAISFKQGTELLAQLRTNTLANVFFVQRQPFSGQPVTVEAPGFQPVTISDIAELGEDGHTLVLSR
jgi:hypothetical protein